MFLIDLYPVDQVLIEKKGMIVDWKGTSSFLSFFSGPFLLDLVNHDEFCFFFDRLLLSDGMGRHGEVSFFFLRSLTFFFDDYLKSISL